LAFKHSFRFSAPGKIRKFGRWLRLMFPRMAGIAVNQFTPDDHHDLRFALAAGSLAIFIFPLNLQKRAP